MPLSIKSFLPAASVLRKGFALATSPLLLAATQSPSPDAMQLSCGLSSGRASAYREVIAPAQSANGQGGIAHPVASSPQPLVTSAQEWTTIWRDATSQATQLEPLPNSLAFIEDVVGAVPTQAQPRCNTKEEPTTEVLPPVQSAPADDIPNLDPSVLPPVAPEAPTPEAPASESPTVTPPSAPPTFAIPARPVSPPPSDPSIDPTNVTPTAEPAAPFDGVVVPTLDALPDGVYRYLSGNYEYGIYSDEQLIANGGAVFLLTKTGNNVVGNFYPQLGQPGVCIDGSLSGNSVVGPAYAIDAIVADSADAEQPADPDENEGTSGVTEVGDSYRPYAGLTSFQVRQPQTVRVGEASSQALRIFYADSLLDLSEYSRINAGTSLDDSECDVPAVDAASSADTD